MNAFNFGFKKKKPVDFSKMKEELKPSNGNGKDKQPELGMHVYWREVDFT